MAVATTIKGGKVRVLLETDTPGVYAAPCGLTSRSVRINKALNEFRLPDCDDPDAVDWLGRDAESLSMTISGEGVLAEQSVETWLDACEAVDSVNAKIEWEFPTKTITWTGKIHVESFEITAQNGQRVTASVSMQSDGQMVRTTTPAS